MQRCRLVVIKIGTKVITAHDRTLDKERIKDLVRQMSGIQDKGTKVILVTSGAIGAGMWLLNIGKRPSGQIARLQAAASIGQSYLMQTYSEYFKEHGYIVGQMLLTQEDFNDRTRYLNIKHTINTLLEYNAIPIINENDTVATDEIKCGDNDRLSGLVADLCQAQKLILLTDVDGLLDERGNTIGVLHGVDAKVLKLGGKSRCDLGTGGMATKIEAARNVTQAGIECVIANGKKKDILLKVLKGEDVGTVFKPRQVKFIARKRWIAYSSRPKGLIKVDDGARAAVGKHNKSLLASGIIGIEGNFDSGDVISIGDKDAREFARGVVNYSSKELAKIKGLKTDRFRDLLGYEGRDEIVHKDGLVIL